MSHFLHYHPITAVSIAIMAFALLKGGSAERLGALMMASEWILEALFDTWLGAKHVAVSPTIALDALLAGGLLLLALRYGRLWLGCALILQSVALALHAMALSDDAPGYNIYAGMLNACTCLLMLSLFWGAVSSLSRSRSVRRVKKARSDQHALTV